MSDTYHVHTFWAQSVTLGALPDSSLIHLVCVLAACAHTRPVISHNIIVWEECRKRRCSLHNCNTQELHGKHEKVENQSEYKLVNPYR